MGSKFKVGAVEKKVLLAGWDKQRDQFSYMIGRNFNIDLRRYINLIKKGLLKEGKRHHQFLLTDLGRLYCVFNVVKQKRESIREAEQVLEECKQWAINEGIIDPEGGDSRRLRHIDNWGM